MRSGFKCFVTVSCHKAPNKAFVADLSEVTSLTKMGTVAFEQIKCPRVSTYFCKPEGVKCLKSLKETLTIYLRLE